MPLAIAAAGVALIIVGGGDRSLRIHHQGSGLSGIGVGLIIVALIVWMVNWMFRMSVQSNRDRHIEEAARRYFDAHGHWPDERDE